MDSDVIKRLMTCALREIDRMIERATVQRLVYLSKGKNQYVLTLDFTLEQLDRTKRLCTSGSIPTGARFYHIEKNAILHFPGLSDLTFHSNGEISISVHPKGMQVTPSLLRSPT